MRLTLVVNPASNKGAAARVGREVADVLARRSDLTVLSGGSQAESVELLRRARDTSDAVLVCGGDGMAHLAVNVLAEGHVPLGIVPAGTGNDAATALGMDPDPLRAAGQLLDACEAGSVRRVDLGRCDAPRVCQDSIDRWWLGMLYAGFDSRVNERANRMRWPHGKRRYDVAIALELLRLGPIELDLGLDERTMVGPVTLVAVGNGPQYGGGKLITPGARMDDGVFDVTVVAPVSRVTLAQLAPRLPTAGHIGHRAVSQYRGRTITMDAPDTVAYADGERLGPLPISTTCVRNALPVLIPTGDLPPGLAGR